MGILTWLVLGLIAGALAQFVVGRPFKEGGCMGIVVTIAVGLIGAVIGGFIGTALGWGEVDEFDVRSIGLAFLGAIAFILVLQALSSGRRR